MSELASPAFVLFEAGEASVSVVSQSWASPTTIYSVARKAVLNKMIAASIQRAELINR